MSALSSKKTTFLGPNVHIILLLVNDIGSAHPVSVRRALFLDSRLIARDSPLNSQKPFLRSKQAYRGHNHQVQILLKRSMVFVSWHCAVLRSISNEIDACTPFLNQHCPVALTFSLSCAFHVFVPSMFLVLFFFFPHILTFFWFLDLGVRVPASRPGAGPVSARSWFWSSFQLWWVPVDTDFFQDLNFYILLT